MFSEYVLFKKGHLNKRAGVWTPWTPPLEVERHSRDQLVEVLPVVLRHQSESAEHRPAEVVEVRVAKVRIVAGLATHVALGARRRVLSAGTDTPRPYHYVADSLTSPRRTS